MKLKSQTGISVQNKEITHITQYEKDKNPDRGLTKRFQLVLWANKKSIMAYKYLKWCLTISVVNKRQIKTTYEFGEQENCQYGRLMRWHSQQAMYTHLWECKLACWLWKWWHDLLEFRAVHTLWSRNFILRIYLCIQICVCLFAQSCSSLCHPRNLSLSGSSVHGGFPRQEYWSGLSFPSPGDPADPGSEPVSPGSPASQADSSPAEPLGTLIYRYSWVYTPRHKQECS